ncbi:MAG: hypothetical protein D6722_21250 [Bacteroidetes bacterium]|nr:MAG: hypothetical protein D6722_21250 [Bacteroidota bacterium]
MNWYRVSSTLLVALFLIGLTSAAFIPRVEIILLTTAMPPFLVIIWVVSILRQPQEEPLDEARSAGWYEHF